MNFIVTATCAITAVATCAAFAKKLWDRTGGKKRKNKHDDYLRETLATRTDIDPCWMYPGWCNSSGYGHYTLAGKTTLAHRRAWELFHGEHPGEMHVLHKCDVPGCFNPHHLWLGTHEDNMKDMVEKGRSNKGKSYDHQGKHLITIPDEIIKELRRRFALGAKLRELAEEFGMYKATLWNIVHFKTRVKVI